MKQYEKQGDKNKIGAYGEEIACRYLVRKNHLILNRNYLRKWGEIDIVSRETYKNKEIVHFIEVKTVSYETRDQLDSAVSYGTWRPEENVHSRKLRKFARIIETWLADNNYEGDWQIDVISVRVVPREKSATLKYIENVII